MTRIRTTTSTESPPLELRAREPVARCLIRRLMVPKVFFDAQWPDESGARIDVLMIDRAGVGDVHVVEVMATSRGVIGALRRLGPVPAQYRWLAAPRSKPLTELAAHGIDRLYPGPGAGRIGIIEVVEMANDLGANILVQAERFPGSLAEPVDNFVSTHAADMEYRVGRVARRR